MIFKIKELIYINTFFKNTVLLAFGSIVAQLFNVLGAPVITRIFDVETIGIYSYIITIVGSCTGVLNLRYDLSIVSAESEDDVYPLIKLCIIIGLINSMFFTFLFVVYTVLIIDRLIIPNYIFIFFFFLLISNALINILTSYNNRNKEYKILTIVSIIRTFSQNVGSILMGSVASHPISLFLPYTIGQYLGLRKQSESLCSSLDSIFSCDKHALKKVLIRYRKMALLSTPAIIANSCSYASITIFIEMLFGMTVVGYYSVSTRVLGLPLALVSGNVGKVFFQEAQDEYVKNECFRNSFNKAFCLLLFLSIPMGLTMFYIAPWACKSFFGESWYIAGEYIRILTPFFMCRFIGTALSPGLLVCSKQQLELAYQVLLFVAALFSYLHTLVTDNNVITFLLNISISSSLVYILLIVLVWHSSRGR